MTMTTKATPAGAKPLLAIKTSPSMSGAREPELTVWSTGDVIETTHGYQAAPSTETRVATLEPAIIARVQARIAELGPEGPARAGHHDAAGSTSISFDAAGKRIDLGRVPRSSSRDALLGLLTSLETVARFH